MTPREAVRRRELAQNAITDALVEMRLHRPENAMVLAAIALLHLSHVVPEELVQSRLRVVLAARGRAL